jgi:hypothetical protein
LQPFFKTQQVNQIWYFQSRNLEHQLIIFCLVFANCVSASSLILAFNSSTVATLPSAKVCQATLGFNSIASSAVNRFDEIYSNINCVNGIFDEIFVHPLIGGIIK